MTYKVLDVCRYVIQYSNERNYGISSLKLQKLLYFIQAYFLIKQKIPCFYEKIEAWDFGPVVLEAYNKYKQYLSMDIPTENTHTMFYKEAITKEDKALIREVVEKFADYSATDLVSLTHKQSPWINSYVPGQHNEIKISAISEYFRKKGEKDMMYFVSIYMSDELDSPLYVFDSYAEAKKFLLDDVANEKAIAAEGVPIEFTMLNYDSPLEVEDTWYARMTWPSGEYVEWNITTLSNSSENWEKFANTNVSENRDSNDF